MRNCLVISPHPDDAVLSVGQFLAGRPGATVATVFTGLPSEPDRQTDYDKLSGFASARDALSVRAEEDRLALAHLAATPIHLPYKDFQYGELNDFELIVSDIERLIDELEPELIVGPLGLVHEDHVTTREAFLQATEGAHVPVYVYEELPARVMKPEAVVRASSEVFGPYCDLVPAFIGTGSLATKMEALLSYRSQLPLFENHHEYLVRERVWELVR